MAVRADGSAWEEVASAPWPWLSHGAAQSYRRTVNPALEQDRQCERDRTADQSAQQHGDRVRQRRVFRPRNSQQTSVNSIGKCTRYRPNEILPPQRASGRSSTRCSAGNSPTPAKTRTSPSMACGFQRVRDGHEPSSGQYREQVANGSEDLAGTQGHATQQTHRARHCALRGRGPRASAGAARWPMTNITKGVTASATPKPIQPARCTTRGTWLAASPER